MAHLKCRSLWNCGAQTLQDGLLIPCNSHTERDWALGHRLTLTSIRRSPCPGRVALEIAHGDERDSQREALIKRRPMRPVEPVLHDFMTRPLTPDRRQIRIRDGVSGDRQRCGKAQQHIQPSARAACPP